MIIFNRMKIPLLGVIMVSLLSGFFFYIQAKPIRELPLDELEKYLQETWGGEWIVHVGDVSLSSWGKVQLHDIFIHSNWFTLRINRAFLPSRFIREQLSAQNTRFPDIQMEKGTLVTAWGSLYLSDFEVWSGPGEIYLIKGSAFPWDSPKSQGFLQGRLVQGRSLINIELDKWPTLDQGSISITQKDDRFILLTQFAQVFTSKAEVHLVDNQMVIKELIYQEPRGRLWGQGKVLPQGINLDFRIGPISLTSLFGPQWQGQIFYQGTLDYGQEVKIDGQLTGDLHLEGVTIWDQFKAQLSLKDDTWVLDDGQAYGQEISYQFHGYYKGDDHGFQTQFDGRPPQLPLGQLQGNLEVVWPQADLIMHWPEEELDLASQLLFLEHGLKVETVQLSGLGSNLHLKGTVGFQGELDLAGQFQGNYELVNYIFPQIFVEDGQVGGPIQIKGEVIEPNLMGNLLVSSGKLYFHQIPLVVENVVGDILLQGRKVLLDNWRAQVNDGILQVVAAWFWKEETLIYGPHSKVVSISMIGLDYLWMSSLMVPFMWKGTGMSQLLKVSSGPK